MAEPVRPVAEIPATTAAIIKNRFMTRAFTEIISTLHSGILVTPMGISKGTERAESACAWIRISAKDIAAMISAEFAIALRISCLPVNRYQKSDMRYQKVDAHATSIESFRVATLASGVGAQKAPKGSEGATHD